MNKILKIFLTLVLALSMMLEIMPANTVHAEDTGSGDETVLPEEPAQEDTGSGDETVLPEEPAQEEEKKEEEGSEIPVVENTEQTQPPVESEEPKKEVALNETAVSREYRGEEFEGLVVKVEYEEGTIPEGAVLKVTPASEEAINAIKKERGEDINVKGADISFWLGDKEIEPKDYSEKKVKVTLTNIPEVTNGGE